MNAVQHTGIGCSDEYLVPQFFTKVFDIMINSRYNGAANKNGGIIMDMITKTGKLVPGFALAVVIAAFSKFLEGLLPIHLIGASVIALFIGMIINNFLKPTPLFAGGLKFTSKKILKFAIILLGASLNGGSAIAAIAPVIDADDTDIAYAMSATFLFDMAMIVLFPIMGHALGLSDMAYGIWAGTAVNDTSSVVAAGYAFSEAAGDFATMVKLTRTLSIVPTVVAFALIAAHLNRKEAMQAGAEAGEKSQVNLVKVAPWFILGFLALTAVNSMGLISTTESSGMKDVSKFLMVSALAAIGLNTSFKDMKKSGIAPMFHGFIISALVVVVAITVEYFMGIV